MNSHVLPGGVVVDSHSTLDSDYGVDLEVSAEHQLGKLIKVLAMGGAGGNAGNYVYRKGLPFVEVAAYNTDQQDLNKLSIEKKYLIGPKVTAMMGAGRDPRLGEEAMRESVDLLYAFLQEEGSDLLTSSRFAFVLGGVGGGTASGAVPVAAEVCKELGYITLAVLTIPSRHNGPEAMRIALESLEKVEQIVDKVILIDNERIYSRLPQEKKTTAFQIIDAKVADAIESFVNIISRVPRENVDPNDIRTILLSSSSKLAVIGTGEGNREVENGKSDSGEKNTRVAVALDNAIDSPILLYNSIVQARSFLLHVVTHPDDGLAAYEERALRDRLAWRANLEDWPSTLSGGGEDSRIEKGGVQVTLIATGFEQITPSGFVRMMLEDERKTQSSRPDTSHLGGRSEDDQRIMSLLGAQERLLVSSKPQVQEPDPALMDTPLLQLPTALLDEETVHGGTSTRRRSAAKTQTAVEVHRSEVNGQLSLFEDVGGLSVVVEPAPIAHRLADGETALERRRRRVQEQQAQREGNT